MACLMEVVGRVAARRTIATPDVPATQAESKMNPRRAQLEALFATGSAGGDGINSRQVMTFHNDVPEETDLQARHRPTMPN